MGSSKWRKVKIALGLKLNMCLYVPRINRDDDLTAAAPSSDGAGRFSNAGLVSPSSSPRSSDCRPEMPTTPTPSSSGLRHPKHSSLSSSKKTCPICLTAMKTGRGHAIFTAECSHSFHFQCITSNVKHGNQICPVCRAKWKEIPFQSPATDLSLGRTRINHISSPQDDALMNAVARQIPPRVDTFRHVSSPFQVTEPNVFDDDELINLHPGGSERNSASNGVLACFDPTGAIEVKTCPEVPAVAKTTSHSNFTILIHLKAPNNPQSTRMDQTGSPAIHQDSHAPIDLVSVLDVSGSMAGTKIALLKRAMGFVIQNLGPSDRLSIIAFSSVARRLFPLRRMTETGKQEALQAVSSLSSNGGTNIADGLRKGAKVMIDRKWKNPVSSIILLSDGQDTYSIGSPGRANRTAYHSLLPSSMNNIPVHTFGFGVDHDAVAMHSISETSGGTFSFIETETVIQDAFAQCIGGLLSVVAQDLRVGIECIHPMLVLTSIKAGSYKTSLTSDARMAFIEVGDLYAEEERDFLVMLDIPASNSIDEMSLLKVKCVYNDMVSKDLVTLDHASDVKIQRPETTGQQVISIEVDRHRNRIRSAEAMAEARVAAERGDLAAAVNVLENCRKQLLETVSAQAKDRLCMSLDAELKEMQERMSNRRTYETSGRAYVLSGLSSHSWQRATARGDSTDHTSLVQSYQTQSMVDMVNKSQTMYLDGPSHGPPRRPSLKQAWSFPARPQPR